MRLIGLSGSVGVGKDSVADYLVAEKAFLKFSFSDALYEEVAAAFDVTVELLKDREGKEVQTPALTLATCSDEAFAEVAYLQATGAVYANTPFSPRQILQWWGTAYRRAQDPDYWVKKAEETVEAFFANLALFARDGTIQGYRDAPGLVNTSVRFPNERALFDKYQGEIWHVYRPGYYSGEREAFESELGLPIETGDRIFINNSTLDRLGTAVDIMLRGNHVVASQDEGDTAWVPVFFPRTGYIVANARHSAHDNARHAPKLGDI